MTEKRAFIANFIALNRLSEAEVARAIGMKRQKFSYQMTKSDDFSEKYFKKFVDYRENYLKEKEKLEFAIKDDKMIIQTGPNSQAGGEKNKIKVDNSTNKTESGQTPEIKGKIDEILEIVKNIQNEVTELKQELKDKQKIIEGLLDLLKNK